MRACRGPHATATTARPPPLVEAPRADEAQLVARFQDRCQWEEIPIDSFLRLHVCCVPHLPRDSRHVVLAQVEAVHVNTETVVALGVTPVS